MNQLQIIILILLILCFFTLYYCNNSSKNKIKENFSTGSYNQYRPPSSQTTTADSQTTTANPQTTTADSQTTTANPQTTTTNSFSYDDFINKIENVGGTLTELSGGVPSYNGLWVAIENDFSKPNLNRNTEFIRTTNIFINENRLFYCYTDPRETITINTILDNNTYGYNNINYVNRAVAYSYQNYKLIIIFKSKDNHYDLNELEYIKIFFDIMQDQGTPTSINMYHISNRNIMNTFIDNFPAGISNIPHVLLNKNISGEYSPQCSEIGYLMQFENQATNGSSQTTNGSSQTTTAGSQTTTAGSQATISIINKADVEEYVNNKYEEYQNIHIHINELN